MDTEQVQVLQYFDVDYDQVHVEEFPPAVQQVLANVNRKVAAQDSLDDIMNFLFEAITPICPCQRVGLAFIEEDGARIVSRWNRAIYSGINLNVGYTEDVQLSSLKHVIDGNKVRVITDLMRYVRMHPDSTSSRMLLEEGVRSSMTCPLYVEGRPVALLFFSSVKAQAFHELDVKQHLAVAERLSQAIEKAYKLEQLEKANQGYLEILGFVSHELKSPLSSIVMDGQLLGDDYIGELAPKQKEKVHAIVNKAEYLLSLVREYLDLARIEGGGFDVHPRPNVDFVAESLQPALDIVMAQIADKHMRLVWTEPSEPIRVELDPQLIRIVLVNLLSNAAKYGRSYGEIKLLTRLEDGLLRVSVWNEGRGWSKDQQGLLFKKFSRLKETLQTKKGGTGVGLYTCWRVVRLHGGRIWGDAQVGQWARFTFELPQPLAVSGQ